MGTGIEDLLDPDPLHAALGQPRQVAGRVGQTVGVIDADAVDQALADQRQRQRVGLIEHLGTLLAHARQVVDVEEPPVAAGDGVDVEELRPQLWVGPVPVGVVGGHVVGDDVQDHPHPGVTGGSAQPPELLFAAERIRQPPRVDHVVAVGRARAGLKRACNPTSLGQNASSTCTVTLTQAAPTGGALVTLTNTNATLSVPASVTVAAAATTATFAATTTTISSNQSATITATYNSSSANATVSLVAPVLVSSLACNPTSLGQNASSTCTVTLTQAAPTGGALVTLTNTNATLTVPASVTVAAAATTATFAATTTTISSNQSATITATYNSSSANATVSLVAPVLVSSLACNPTSLGQNASSTCTVTLTQAAPTGGALVTLTNTNATLSVPASVTVAAAATTATFAATTTTISSNQSATITATYNSSSANATVSLVAPVLVSSLACNPTSLGQNASSTCTVTLTHRVGQEIERDLFDRATIGLQLDCRSDARIERQTLLVGTGGDDAQAVGQDVIELNGFRLEADTAGFDLRHVEDVTDHVEQIAAAFADVARVFAVFFRPERPEHSQFHDFGETDDGVERRAQLVAHIGEEFGFRLVRLLGAGFFRGVFERQIGELAGLEFQRLLRAAQVVDRRDLPLLSLDQLLLVLLELGDVGADRDIAAVLGPAFADMQPAPVIEERFEGAGARRLRLVIGDRGPDDRFLSGGHDRGVSRAGYDGFVRQVMQLLEVRVAQDQAVVGVPQHECFRNRLDGVAQPQVRRRGLLHQRPLLGGVDGDADEVQAGLAVLARQFAARPQPQPAAVGVAHAEGVIDRLRLGVGQLARQLVEVDIVPVHQGVDFAESQEIVFRRQSEKIEHRVRPEHAAAREVPIP